MTDLERLESVWPLGWQECSCPGEYRFCLDLRVSLGAKVHRAVSGSEVWDFWHDDKFCGTHLGIGDLTRAAKQAAFTLAARVESLESEAQVIRAAVQRLRAERSEA